MTVQDKPSSGGTIPFFEYIRFTEIKRLIHQTRMELDRRALKSFSVISEFPGEGKTFFVAVLAVGFAHLLRKKVLIVDTTTQTQGGNLFLDRIFQSHDERFGGSKSGNQFVDLVSTKNTTGSSDESADFDIGPMTDVYRDKYDLVIFDTCAMALANKNNMDPVIISKHAGASVLVQTQKSVDVDSLKNIREQLNNWDIALVGTVFNAAPRKK